MKCKGSQYRIRNGRTFSVMFSTKKCYLHIKKISYSFWKEETSSLFQIIIILITNVRSVKHTVVPQFIFPVYAALFAWISKLLFSRMSVREIFKVRSVLRASCVKRKTVHKVSTTLQCQVLGSQTKHFWNSYLEFNAEGTLTNPLKPYGNKGTTVHLPISSPFLMRRIHLYRCISHITKAR